MLRAQAGKPLSWLAAIDRPHPHHHHQAFDLPISQTTALDGYLHRALVIPYHRGAQKFVRGANDQIHVLVEQIGVWGCQWRLRLRSAVMALHDLRPLSELEVLFRELEDGSHPGRSDQFIVLHSGQNSCIRPLLHHDQVFAFLNERHAAIRA